MSIQARTLQITGVTAGVTASIGANGIIRAVHLRPDVTSEATRPQQGYLCSLKYQDAAIGLSPATNGRSASVIWYPGGITASTIIPPAVAGDVDVIVTGAGLGGIVTVTLLVEQ